MMQQSEKTSWESGHRVTLIFDYYFHFPNVSYKGAGNLA